MFLDISSRCRPKLVAPFCFLVPQMPLSKFAVRHKSKWARIEGSRKWIHNHIRGLHWSLSRVHHHLRNICLQRQLLEKEAANAGSPSDRKYWRQQAAEMQQQIRDAQASQADLEEQISLLKEGWLKQGAHKKRKLSPVEKEVVQNMKAVPTPKRRPKPRGSRSADAEAQAAVPTPKKKPKSAASSSNEPRIVRVPSEPWRQYPELYPRYERVRNFAEMQINRSTRRDFNPFSLLSSVPPFINIGDVQTRIPSYFDIDSTSVADREQRNERNRLRNRFIQQALQEGLPVSYRSTGNSLSPMIRSGMQCHYRPVDTDTELKEQDIVFCVVEDVNTSQPRHFAHKIWQIVVLPSGRTRYMIANAKGHCNGWVDRQDIFGKLVHHYLFVIFISL